MKLSGYDGFSYLNVDYQLFPCPLPISGYKVVVSLGCNAVELVSRYQCFGEI
jgi:hypothetical protein